MVFTRLSEMISDYTLSADMINQKVEKKKIFEHDQLDLIDRRKKHYITGEVTDELIIKEHQITLLQVLKTILLFKLY